MSCRPRYTLQGGHRTIGRVAGTMRPLLAKPSSSSCCCAAIIRRRCYAVIQDDGCA
jgi:hypothetical protein